MKRFSANSEKSEPRASSSGSASATHLGTTNSGSGSGTTRQRMDGRGARMSTSGIGVAPFKSAPPSRSSATKATATTTDPTSERDAQQRYPSPSTPTKMVGFDCDVDVVQWQSSQTTNPALITLLKEASSEESMLRFQSSSSRISPSWQHSPTKLPTSVTTPIAASSSSASKYSSLGSVSFSDMVVDSHSTSGRMRIRPPASKSATTPLTPHSHVQQNHRQTNVKFIENGDNPPESGSLFSSSNPNKILEMMRGVSAKIDENMAVNTPVAKSKGKEKATSIMSTRTRQMGRSLSSMDIDVSVDGFGGGSAYNNMGKGNAHERNAKRGSMMAIDETDDASADADVSMAYVGAVVDSLDPPEILHSSVEVSRRKEVLPPTLLANKIKPMPPRAGTTSSSTSAQQVHVADRARSAVVSVPTSTLTADATVDVNDDPKPKDPYIQLHPLLREKEHRKETKRSQASSPLSVDAMSVSGIRRHGPTFPNLFTKTPLTRSMSASIAPTASELVRPAQSFFLSPNASQSSRQNPPRLGGNSSITTGKAAVVANKGNSGKLLAKPFKPPLRKTTVFPDRGSQQNSGHTAQHGHSQQTTASASPDYATSSRGSSRAAYPSPSPNSDEDGKKGKERQISLIAEEELGSTRLSMRGRPRSPPALPPTPESVLNGVSGSEGQEDNMRLGKRESEGHRARDDLDEDVEEMGGADPDSSYGHMTLDIDIDALEETMKMFD